MRLSTVIPNYNHGHEISHAIEAVAAQQPPPGEIIVVDDGSTDGSLDILRSLQQKHPTLRIVALERNGGVVPALNRGLHEARGTYINFGAADDVVRPGLYARMLELVEKHPDAAFASCECEVLDLDTGQAAIRPPVRPSQKSAYFDPAQVQTLLRSSDNWVLTGTAVVRRDLLLAAGGFDKSLGSFADAFVMRSVALQHGFCFAPQLGLTWRVSSLGYSRSLAGKPEAFDKLLQDALERMRADPAFPEWYPPVFTRRWHFAMGRTAIAARPMNTQVLQHLWRDPASRALIAMAAPLGALGRLALLGWITIRQRPTSLTGLARTALARWIETALPER